MIKEKEIIEAFEVLHDYCDERECSNCLFYDENCERGNMCLLRNNNPAYLRVEEIPIVRYKITRG